MDVRSGLMDDNQLGFSDDEQTTARKKANRETFLLTMEAALPWDALSLRQ